MADDDTIRRTRLVRNDVYLYYIFLQRVLRPPQVRAIKRTDGRTDRGGGGLSRQNRLKRISIVLLRAATE